MHTNSMHTSSSYTWRVRVVQYKQVRGVHTYYAYASYEQSMHTCIPPLASPDAPTRIVPGGHRELAKGMGSWRPIKHQHT